RAIREWDVASGQPMVTQTLTHEPQTLYYGGVGSVAWADLERFGFTPQVLGSHEGFYWGRVHTDSVLPGGLVPQMGTLTASGDGTLKVWAGTYRDPIELAVARGGFREVLCAASSPDSRWVVAGYGDGHVRLWELAVPPHRAIVGAGYHVAFLGAGRRLVSAGDVYDFSAGLPPGQKSYRVQPTFALAVI